jgi:hypothetical protein
VGASCGNRKQIYNALMTAVKEGRVPFGYYGPETCRWATPDEMRRFGLEDCLMVHLDKSGEIDCYFTETGATVVPGRRDFGLRSNQGLCPRVLGRIRRVNKKNPAISLDPMLCSRPIQRSFAALPFARHQFRC